MEPSYIVSISISMSSPILVLNIEAPRIDNKRGLLTIFSNFDAGRDLGEQERKRRGTVSGAWQ